MINKEYGVLRNIPETQEDPVAITNTITVYRK